MGKLKEFDLGLTYVPHMTVGKLVSPEKLHDAYEDIKDMNHIFETMVDKISVEIIGEHEESIIVIEKNFV